MSYRVSTGSNVTASDSSNSREFPVTVSVMFWNVENFGRNLQGRTPDPDEFRDRVDRVATHITTLDPDVFALSEIKDKVALRSLLMDKLTDYDFGVTDGRQGIELLAGWRRNRFDQVVFTQRREFKADSPFLRPGSVVSARVNGEYLNFLFLHTDSGTKSTDYNNRQEMFEKIWSLKAAFDAVTDGGSAKFMTLGDLNTMGRRKSGSLAKVTGSQEITELADDASDNDMSMLCKTHGVTWFGGDNFQSNLDHVLATTNLDFKQLSNASSAAPARVSVDGWVHLDGDERTEFADGVSDHCSLYCEIQ